MNDNVRNLPPASAVRHGYTQEHALQALLGLSRDSKKKYNVISNTGSSSSSDSLTMEKCSTRKPPAALAAADAAVADNDSDASQATEASNGSCMKVFGSTRSKLVKVPRRHRKKRTIDELAAASTTSSASVSPVSSTLPASASSAVDRSSPPKRARSTASKLKSKSATGTAGSVGSDADADAESNQCKVNGNGIAMPTDNDVLCGRGGKIPFHTGNKRFRELVAKYRASYLSAKKNAKPEISRGIVRLVQANGGRFLKQDAASGMWYQISDAAALDKTSQQMRTVFRDEIDECKRFKAKMELAGGVFPSPGRLNSFRLSLPNALDALPQKVTQRMLREIQAETVTGLPTGSTDASAVSAHATRLDIDALQPAAATAKPDPASFAANAAIPGPADIKLSIPPAKEGIAKYTDDDILCGRGGAMTKHPGNQNYRRLIDQFRTVYFKARKKDKPQVSRKVVSIIRSKGGRFLKQKEDGLWYEVGDHVAFEKTSQQIRDKDELQKLVSKQLKEAQETTQVMLLATRRQVQEARERERHIRRQAAILTAQQQLADQEAAKLKLASALASGPSVSGLAASSVVPLGAKSSVLHDGLAGTRRLGFLSEADLRRSSPSSLTDALGCLNPVPAAVASVAQQRASMSSTDSMRAYLSDLRRNSTAGMTSARPSSLSLPSTVAVADSSALARALLIRQHPELARSGSFL